MQHHIAVYTLPDTTIGQQVIYPAIPLATISQPFDVDVPNGIRGVSVEVPPAPGLVEARLHYGVDTEVESVIEHTPSSSIHAQIEFDASLPLFFKLVCEYADSETTTSRVFQIHTPA